MDDRTIDGVAKALGCGTSRRSAILAAIAGAFGLGTPVVANAKPIRRREKMACRNAGSECMSGDECCSGSCVPKPGGTGFRCAKSRKHGDGKDKKGGGGSDVVPSETCMVCSSGCAYSSVQDAINANLDEIVIGEGTYVESLVINRWDTSILMRACNNDLVVLQNASDGERTLLAMNKGLLTLELRDLSIARNPTWEYGGGITSNAALTLSGSTKVLQAKNSDAGGGIKFGDGSFERTLRIMDDVEIADNHADSYGGGIYIDASGELIMFGNAAVRGNYATSFGGGIYLNENSVARLHEHVVIDGNSARKRGGGIFGYGPGRGGGNIVEADGSVQITHNSTYNQSSVTGDQEGGAGIGLIEGSISLSNEVLISNNTAHHNGGGINTPGALTISGTVSITGNTANNTAGGVFGLTNSTGSGSLTVYESASITANTPNNCSGTISC